eukprot:4923647-Prymnesium_polylepis.1
MLSSNRHYGNGVRTRREPVHASWSNFLVARAGGECPQSFLAARKLDGRGAVHNRAFCLLPHAQWRVGVATIVRRKQVESLIVVHLQVLQAHVPQEIWGVADLIEEPAQQTWHLALVTVNTRDRVSLA